MNKTKNPREVKKAIMAKEIVDLHGNIFKVIKGWEFYNKVPNLEGNYTWIFTRDRITDTQFILALNEELNIAVGYWYSNIYQLYVARPLKRIRYDESKDIRKEYLYNGKRQHKKDFLDLWELLQWQQNTKRVRILKIYKGIQLHYQSLVDG